MRSAFPTALSLVSALAVFATEISAQSNPSDALVLTVTLGGRPVQGFAYRVCVGTPRDLQEYGIETTDGNGQAQFPDAPVSGDLLISIEAVRQSSVMYGATVSHRASKVQRTVTIALAPNPMVKCPGATRRSLPESFDSTGIVGTLRHTGTPLAVGRNLTFYTTAASGVRAIEVSGGAREYRTRQDGGPFTNWQSATVTQGNLMTGVAHQITGDNGRKSVTLQLRSARFVPSPMYTVEVDFAEIYSCNLQYRRADNALAGFGQPDESLGLEDVRLRVGERKTFDTFWPSPNEKRRGFGMHLRTANNIGDHAVELTVRRVDRTEAVVLAPGVQMRFQVDLVSVRCP